MDQHGVTMVMLGYHMHMLIPMHQKDGVLIFLTKNLYYNFY